MDEYSAIQGDTWDLIAYKMWGSEYLLPLLLEANPEYRKVVIFSGGEQLAVPKIDEAIYTDRPSWLGDVDEL